MTEKRVLRPRSARLTATVLLSFAVAFAALTISSFVQKSLTIDEAGHITKGYIAAKIRGYQFYSNTPPALEMWFALPSLMMRNVTLDTNNADFVAGDIGRFCPTFLFRQNDCDALLWRARFMSMLLGILLGIMLFCWARSLFGWWPAIIVLTFYTLEPNILAHSSLATTDFGVTCFIFGTLYFLWRLTRRFSIGNLAGLAIFLTLANVSKFSALLLWPIVIALLAFQVFRKHEWVCPLVTLITLIVVCDFGIWMSYGFRYAPLIAPHAQFYAETQAGLSHLSYNTTEVRAVHLENHPKVMQLEPVTASVIRWIDDHKLLPNAYSENLLLEIVQMNHVQWVAFLAGKKSTDGWWYYFPIAFLIKTPIAVILLFSGAVILCALRWRVSREYLLFIILPIAVYFGAAVLSRLDIGLRFILPIYPFVLLIAGMAAAELLQRRKVMLLVLLVGLSLAEFVIVYPHYLAFFNLSIGGPRNGYKYLVDSNLDVGQDLKLLKRWMERNGVHHINLCYNGNADPAYYGINCTYLPPMPFSPESLVVAPRLPGYVAVSVHQLQMLQPDPPGTVPYGPLLRGEPVAQKARRPNIGDLYEPFLRKEPVAVIGYSMRVYWMDRPWWEAKTPQASP